MRFFKKHTTKNNQEYKHRIFLSILLVEILLIITVRYWPIDNYEPKKIEYNPPSDQVLIDDVQITKQVSSPPPPPKPRYPQPVPTDEIIEVELDIVDVNLDLPELPDLDPEFGTGTKGEDDIIVSNPQIPPSVVRIVEATAPEQVPEEYKGNLEMIVNFLVDKEGNVEEVSIMEIRLYKNGEYEQLPFVQHGLMDAVVRAAFQWRFRPAKQDGREVKAFTKQRFNY